MNVVILDSGIDKTHKEFENIQITEYICRDGQREWVVQNDLMKPKNGHGTAVTSVLLKYIDNIDINILSFRIFEDEEAAPETLIGALQYIDQYVECSVINISLGVCKHYLELEALCERLWKKGIVIISAFSNLGTISFPAAYPSVIGVDSVQAINKLNEYVYVDNSLVNIGMAAVNQRVAWTEPQYVIVRGNSFIAPVMAAKVCKMLAGEVLPKNILEAIRKDAVKTILFTYDDNE